MLSERDNFLQLLSGNEPERLVNCYGPFVGLMSDPVGAYTMGMFNPDGRDAWGVTFAMNPGEPGRMPVTDEEHKVIHDVTRWREQVQIPDLIANCSDPKLWEASKAEVQRIHDQGNLAMVVMASGLFERLHYLMGFEDALTNLLLEPEDTAELIEAIGENRLTQTKLLIENLHPDAILFHDDWGTHQGLFMRPDTWREFFKEPYRRIYSYARSQGVIVVHHADSHCTEIAEDMAAIGIQVWQGVLPQNDINGIQNKLGKKLLLMGGLESALIDREDATEEEIRAEVRRAIRDYAAGGAFIPCPTQGLPRGTIKPQTYDLVADEIARYNQETYGCSTLPAEQIPMGMPE